MEKSLLDIQTAVKKLASTGNVSEESIYDRIPLMLDMITTYVKDEIIENTLVDKTRSYEEYVETPCGHVFQKNFIDGMITANIKKPIDEVMLIQCPYKCSTTFFASQLRPVNSAIWQNVKFFLPQCYCHKCDMLYPSFAKNEHDEMCVMCKSCKEFHVFSFCKKMRIRIENKSSCVYEKDKTVDNLDDYLTHLTICSYCRGLAGIKKYEASKYRKNPIRTIA